MQLIDNANQLHKTWSFVLAAAGVVISLGEQILPIVKDVLPPHWQLAMFVAVAAARAIKQPSLEQK